jgi:response regulator RpfG family c-di-GMP phosphodiesterase
MESVTLDVFTKKLYLGFKYVLNIDRLAFAAFENGLIKAEFAHSASETVFLKPPFAQHYLKSSLGKVGKGGKVRIINDLKAYLLSRKDSGATELLLKEGMFSSLTFPLMIEDRCIGFLFLNSNKKNNFSEDISKSFAFAGKLLSMAYHKIMLMDKTIMNTIVGLTELSEKRDNETGLHMKRIAMYSKAVCEELILNGIYSNEINYIISKEISEQSPLHDIGKVGIQDNILLKPGKLSPDEFNAIKEHSAIGHTVLNKINTANKLAGGFNFKTGEEIIRHHHEKWDGSGYPDGLKGENIPLSARIVAVADVFDALTSKRPYKEPFSIEKSLEIIKKSSGSHFDPKVVNAFLNAEDKIRCIHKDYAEIENFKEAAQAHSKWAEIVIKAVNGDKSQTDEAELLPTRCRAGVFLESAAHSVKSKKALEDIVFRHNAVHKIAEKLLTEMHDDPVVLENDLGRFRDASDNLEKILESFSEKQS